MDKVRQLKHLVKFSWRAWFSNSFLKKQELTICDGSPTWKSVHYKASTKPTSTNVLSTKLCIKENTNSFTGTESFNGNCVLHNWLLWTLFLGILGIIGSSTRKQLLKLIIRRQHKSKILGRGKMAPTLSRPRGDKMIREKKTTAKTHFGGPV